MMRGWWRSSLATLSRAACLSAGVRSRWIPLTITFSSRRSGAMGGVISSPIGTFYGNRCNSGDARGVFPGKAGKSRFGCPIKPANHRTYAFVRFGGSPLLVERGGEPIALQRLVCIATRPSGGGTRSAGAGSAGSAGTRSGRGTVATAARRQLGFAAHREGDSVSGEIDLHHGHHDALLRFHDRRGVLHERVGELAHMHEPVLMNADVDERAECGDVRHDTR